MEYESKEHWMPISYDRLARHPSVRVVRYLMRLLKDVRLDVDDTFEVRLRENMVRFHCSYLTHCRLAAKMGDMFVNHGISFDEMSIKFVNGKVRSKEWTFVSPVVEVTIKVQEAHKNKCNIEIENEMEITR